MAEQVQFELVSPERLLVSRPVEMVVVPGVEGDFGVLPGHAPLISEVRPGVIAVFEGGKVEERIFVAGGFAEVTAERCTVLAEQALPSARSTAGRPRAISRTPARTWPTPRAIKSGRPPKRPSPSPRPRSRPSRRRSTEGSPPAAPRRARFPAAANRNPFARRIGRRHG
jgi:ATP synthase, F1 epsilon subunit (delta in mitochondria)